VRTFNAYIQVDPDTGMYFGIFPGIPGAYTQGETLEDLRANLKEVLKLVLEESPEVLEDLPEFVGIEEIEVSI
jgi:predicted RNase H-like HicB family nuclease